MSRNRLAVVVAVLVVFVMLGGVLVYSNRNHGGQNITFDVTVTGAKAMQPSDLSAHQNDTVTINMTSDTDGEVHMHGYDIHFDNKAGVVNTHTFKADKTGNFDIEWESASTPLGHFVVT